MINRILNIFKKAKTSDNQEPPKTRIRVEKTYYEETLITTDYYPEAYSLSYGSWQQVAAVAFVEYGVIMYRPQSSYKTLQEAKALMARFERITKGHIESYIVEEIIE